MDMVYSVLSYLFQFHFVAIYATLGAVIILHNLKVGRREIVTLQEGKGGFSNTIIMLAGYAMPVESWEWTVKHSIHKNDRVLGFRRRYQENHTWWLWPISWAPNWWQKREVRTMMARLLEDDHKAGIITQYTVVAHSFGCTMAYHLLKEFPKQVIKRCVPICSPTPARSGFLLHGQFWANARIAGPVQSFIMLILFCVGYYPTKRIMRRLFTGPRVNEAELAKLHANAVRESSIVFYSHLLFERGLDLRQAAINGWNGELIFVLCPTDPIFRAEDIKTMASMRPCGQVYELGQQTPHCFWLESDPTTAHMNAAALALAIYGKNDEVELDEFFENASGIYQNDHTNTQETVH